MNQNQLNREVAQATGESVGFIRSLGFNVVIVPPWQTKPKGDGAQTNVQPSKPATVNKQPLRDAA